jgi:DNA-binding PadR family transcriptional regulator
MAREGVGEGSGAPMRSRVQWALLGLVIERPSYAYDLAMRFDREFDGMLRLSGSSYVYTAVRALVERGLVEERPGTGGGRQPRPRYHATAAGLRAYGEWLSGQVDEERRRFRLFAREFAVLAREPKLALEILDRHEDRMAADGRPGPVRALAARLEAEGQRSSLENKRAWIEVARREFTALVEDTRPT